MKKHIPPNLPLRFFRWFCHPDLVKYIEGDLIELFEERVEARGVKKAKWLFVWDVVKLFRPSIIRPTEGIRQFNNYGMLKNYFNVAIRSFRKEKSYTAINVIGLTLGISVAIIIGLVIQFELSYDDFHTNKDRIYRVMKGDPQDSPLTYDTGVPHGLTDILKTEFPEIEKVAVAYMLAQSEGQIKMGEALIKVPQTYFVSPSFFEIFDFEWVTGNPSLSLSEPGQVVIDERMQDEFFDGDALGKVIEIDNTYSLTITGIVKESPNNTDFPMRIAMSYATFENTDDYQKKYSDGSSSAHQAFVLLKENTDPHTVNKKFPEMITRHLGEEISEKYMAHYLQPLNMVHFDQGGNNFSNRYASKDSLWAWFFIGILVLSAACINFINLTTAVGVKRSKEVGIRKVLGTTRLQLILQLIISTFLLTTFSTCLAVLVAVLAIPSINTYLDIPLHSEILFQLNNILSILAASLIISLMAGLYPALVSTRFNPLDSIKMTLTNVGQGGLILRRVLVVMQLMISQVLVIGATVAAIQIYTFNTQSMGFDKEGVLTVDIPYNKKGNLDKLRNDLLQYPAIKEITFSLNTPSSATNNWWTGIRHHSSDEHILVEHKPIDEYYLAMYDIPLLAGRNISANDSTAIIINETFMRTIGVQDPYEALDETIKFWGKKNIPIVGVVADFNSNSLKDEVHSVMLWKKENLYQKMSAKVNLGQASAAIDKIETHWKEQFPNHYFESKFLDDELSTFYKNERRLSNMMFLFALIAIIISALGLYGMISFITAQKTKEVGIRKVLGASIGSILYLFSKEFVILIGFASVIAAPSAYYFMNLWLEDFAYRIEISWWIFVLAILLCLVIIALSIGVRSLKAALANPVDSLRYE